VFINEEKKKVNAKQQIVINTWLSEKASGKMSSFVGSTVRCVCWYKHEPKGKIIFKIRVITWKNYTTVQTKIVSKQYSIKIL
jgi:hypothetical protein